MLRSFFLVAFRNLRKNGLYTFINISGLSVGIVSAILIVLWVIDEVSFDKFIPKYDRLYQVWISSEFDDRINNWRSVPLPTYDAMKTIDSNIKNSAVSGWGGDRLLTVGDTRLIKHGYYVSEEFLEMFEFPLVAGSATEALRDPLSIVLSESLAKLLFGEEDPIGKQVKLSDQGTLMVTAIVEDVPENSTFQFDYLATWKYRESVTEWVKENRTNWGNYSFQVYVELNDPSREFDVEESIAGLLMEKDGGDGLDKHFFLHPMTKWRLYSNFDDDGEESGGRSDYVQLFTVVAIVILIIACINFMNLSTARSEKRAKEVGIRKSLGSNRGRLIGQFIGESTLITFLAFFLAIILTQLILPSYNQLVDKQLMINYTSWHFWVGTFGGIAILGLASGSYPAFYLSSFHPVKTLKGSIKAGKGASTPRKVLVVSQFVFSIFLVICTIVIFQQIDLVKNRDLGYQQENLISVEVTNDLADNYKLLKQSLLESGMVENVTRSNSQITAINSNNFLGWPGKPEDQRVVFTTIAADYDYAETMGIDVLQGRDFSKEFATDSQAIVINKAALDLMGLEDPLGTNLDLWGDKRKLIGVVDNVLMGSLYEPVKPMFVILSDWGGYLSLRLKRTKDLQKTMREIEGIFEKYNPAYPFEYKFADVEFQRKFTTITLTRKLATIFSFLAILITGLGIFGMSSFMAEQRTKEIGIRKVLGATTANLIMVLSSEFSKLVIAAFLLAAPTAWYLMDMYLDRYTVRTDVALWVLPLVGILIFLFTLLIVSDQARRAARANPVDSLRAE